MNRYSKINCSDSNKSRSTDLFPLPQTPRKSTSSNPKPNPPTSKTHESAPKNTPPEQEDDDEVNGKRFGEVLSRARSVSSSATTPRTSSSASSTPRAMMKRAFSMRRSSSVSEGYSRIHDRSVSLASPIEDDDEEGVVGSSRSGKKKDKRGKILKVCKRLFGL